MRTQSEGGRTRRGMALMLVLAALALSLALLVALLSFGRREIALSAAAARSEEVQLLARLPVLDALRALDQLRRATSAPNGEARLWTSQPGLIRIWPASEDDSGQVIRLYSHLLPDDAPWDAAEALGLVDWRQRPAACTDLNQPRWSAGSPVFPIADPAAVAKVEGFELTALPAADGAHPLPMPAAWIYVLRDGRRVRPLPGAGDRAVFAEEWISEENPIVGRYAFWTDDESCKLNLNTASEPVFDGPAHARTRADTAMQTNRPAAGEFHRLPGHPAFTALSPVLAGLGEETGTQPLLAPKEAGPAECWPFVRAALQWNPNGPTPESCDAGSRGGSAAVSGKVIPRQDERYLLLGDALLSPQKIGWPQMEFPLPVTRKALRERAFLLTTHSAAPELTPWGGPKVSLWPVFAEVSLRGALDETLASAAEHDGSAFYFQRAAPWLPGEPGSSQSMTADWSVVRNRELLDYLTGLTDRVVPGYDGALVETHGAANRDQLLLSMIDLLRWAVNPLSAAGVWAQPPPGKPGAASALPLLGPEAVEDGDSPARRGFGRFPTVTEVAVVIAFTEVERDAAGQPLDADGDGFCDRATKLRAFMIVEPCLVAPGAPAPAAALCYRFRRLMHWRIGRQNQSLLLPGGSVLNRCTFDASMPYPPGVANASWDDTGGSMPGLAAQFLQRDGSPKLAGQRDDPDRDFPFLSEQDVALASGEGAPGSRLPFNCGFITLDVLPVDAAPQSPRPNDSVQSIELSFTPQELVVPKLRVADFAGGPRDLARRFLPVASVETGRDGRPVQVWRLPLIQEGDLVRSVELNPDGPSGGDVRLIAARRWVPMVEVNGSLGASPRYFRDHPAAVEDPEVAESHSLRESRFQWTGRHYGQGPPDWMPPPAALDHASGGAAFEDGPFILRMSAGGAFEAAGRYLGGSPLGQVSSAFVFGGLPTGLFGRPGDDAPCAWQSLRLHPFGGTASWPPAPVHLWLELFWMPVTEPRLLSRHLATEGKVNLNHRLVPFPWIQRRSALHGVLKGVEMTVIPADALDAAGDHAKRGRAGDGGLLDASFRYAIDAGKTLRALDAKLDRDGAFRTPSEITEIPLAPARVPGRVYAGNGWSAADPQALEGGALRDWCATAGSLLEEPYAALYPRLCTRSNVFRVHYRVQVLRQPRGVEPAVWDEGKGRIAAEQRGSALIERRLREEDGGSADPATAAGRPIHLDGRHHCQILSTEMF